MLKSCLREKTLLGWIARPQRALVGSHWSVTRSPAQTLPRFMSTDNERKTVTLIPGDGIGPEVADAVKHLFAEVGAPVDWEEVSVSSANSTPQDPLGDEIKESMHKHKVGLKGPLATPIGKGHRSLNLALRKEFNLYVNVRPAKTLPGIDTPFKDVDVVVMRENTEGEYSGIEHSINPQIAQSVKVITRSASKKVAHYAFKYAQDQKREKVSAIHKANIMQLVDGTFLKACKDVSQMYPSIAYEQINVDKAMMQLVQNPSNYDVLVLPNLYGDIASDLCAGLIGGLGLTPSGNIGEDLALFEAVHGTAPDIAGKNMANPTALLLSGVMMLRHLDMVEQADVLECAVDQVFREGKHLTGDLGGSATCSEYTDALCQAIHKQR